MKKKFLFLSAACVLLSLSKAEAQSSPQIRAGVNFANVSVQDDGSVNDANSLTSVHVGVIGDVPLAGKFLSLQPGILFTGKGSKIQRGDANSNGYFKQTSNPYYLEVPVNFVFKAPLGGENKFFVGAGPYAAVGIAGRTKTEGRTLLGSFERENKIRFSDDDPTTFSQEEGTGLGVLKRFDYGFNGTAGIEGRSLVVGVNYGLGLAKLQSGTNNNKDNNNKHRVLGVTLGFKF
jgi:hypothetical protein